MITTHSVILVIEDNEPMLLTLRRALEHAGYDLCVFRSVEEAKGASAQLEQISCAIVDLDLPRGGALLVQKYLNHAHPGIPVIFVSRNANLASGVEVMKAGALDVLVAPVEKRALLKVIRQGVRLERLLQEECDELSRIGERFDKLTPRESEVMEYLLRGLINKQIAAELGTCEKTIKVHRGRIMKKIGIQSIAELVQMVMRLRGGRASTPPSLPSSVNRPRPTRARGSGA